MADPGSLSIAERLIRLPRLWFTFATPVRRLEYAVSGFLLVPVKYGLDSFLYGMATSQPWSLVNYVNPLISTRMDGVSHGVQWSIWAMALVTIPFVWLGMSMTVRRCLDASVSPWLSLLFFVPAINYLLMLTLCFLPSRREPQVEPLWKPPTRPAPPLRDVVASISVGAVIGLAMLVSSVLFLQEYGVALFIGTPFTMGALSAFVLNRRSSHGFGATFGVTQLTLLISALAILLFALEGIGCLIMAYPLAILLSLMGALLGYGVAVGPAGSGRAPVAPMVALLCGLPVLLAADTGLPGPPLRVVMTSIDIAAPPEAVWDAVIDFPDLEEPTELIFHAGIAYPVSARIDGSGVGAVRHCQFNTGAFVEPITVWEPPRRLAFDVVDQPPSMDELTPYERIYAPHVLDGLVSQRGEFRLIPTGDGGTRLEGRTWYTVDFWPQTYWSVWSDAIIHRIHLRVLRHVREVAIASRAEAVAQR